MTETQFIDRQQLLGRCLNDPAFMRQMLDVFSNFVPQTVANLRAALDAGDVEATRRFAHTLKGSAANVSAEALRQIAFAAEQSASKGDLAAVRSHLPQIESLLGRCLEDVVVLKEEPAN